MNIDQEPKYDAIDGKIVNRATGVPIPDDEPVFILRAKDAHAVNTLTHYLSRCTNQQHRQVVADRVLDFHRFSTNHPDRMKTPDTDR